MKARSIFYILIFFFFISCSGSVNESSTEQKKRSEPKPASKSRNVKSKTQRENSAHIAFPFGSPILSTYKFPTDFHDLNNLEKEAYQKYIKASQFYYVLNKKPSLLSLEVKEVAHIRVNFPYEFEDNVTHLIDSIRYKLPNIGPYECYYSFQQSPQQMGTEMIPLEEEQLVCNSAGNLILYDRKQNKAKVITIYFNVSGGWSEIERLFYINTKKEIQVFKAVGDEGAITFHKEFTAFIKQDGEVVIQKH